MQKGNKKVIILSCYQWQQKGNKVGLHYFGEYFLKKGFDVFWLTTPISLISFLSPSYYNEKILKLKDTLKGEKIYNYNSSNLLINFVPFVFFHPANHFFLNDGFVIKNYLKLSIPSIKKILKKYNFLFPDILLCDVGGLLLENVLNYLKPKLKIYRISDLVKGFQDVPKPFYKIEENIIKNWDVILPVNKEIYKYAEKIRRKRMGIYCLPNGVEVDIFFKRKEEPEIYKKIPRPRIVYAGSLDFWFDWELLFSVAKMNKQFSFVIIGPYQKIPKNLLPNIFLIGSVPHENLPSYFNHADVGIIPFRNCSIVKPIERPLKFYEYLASGLPVVSVSYGALKRGMSPYAFFGNTPQEFSLALKKALKISSKERERFRKIAKKFSWDIIFKKLDIILNKYIKDNI